MASKFIGKIIRFLSGGVSEGSRPPIERDSPKEQLDLHKPTAESVPVKDRPMDNTPSQATGGGPGATDHSDPVPDKPVIF